MENIHVTLPEGLVLRAKKNGINVSGTCAIALESACRKLEQPDPKHGET